MARPPLARVRVLDAFEAIILDEGERTATLDATAKAAGVSKGGLLYHFSSKDDLIAGLLDRAEVLAKEDLELMSSAPGGPVAYFLRTSITSDSALERALVAVARVAHGGSVAAFDTLRSIRDDWADALRPHVRDETALDLVLLVSDGLYYNNALDGADPTAVGAIPAGDRFEGLIALVLSAVSGVDDSGHSAQIKPL